MLREPDAPWTARIAAVMLCAPIVFGACDRLSGKDEGKCTQALSVARTALEQENFELVRQWRAYAYKHCADESGLTSLDGEIQAKQEEIAKRKVKNQRAAQIVQLFATFATQHMASPRGQCFAQGHPEQGWCTRTQGVSGESSSFDVKYNRFEPDWARFDTVIDGEVACTDVGATEVRIWSVSLPAGGVGKRSQCSFTAGGLKGFSALISVEPNGTRVTLVSPKQLSRDPALRHQLENEGQ